MRNVCDSASLKSYDLKLTVKLFFDATDERQDDLASGVVEQTDRFYSLVKIHPDLHAPPICRFGA